MEGDHRPVSPARGTTSLDAATLRLIHEWREAGVQWDDVDARFPERRGTVRHAYLRAVRGGALAAALGEDAAEVPRMAPELQREAPAEAAADDSGEQLRREEQADGTVTLEAPSSSLIRTLDELLAIGGVDPDLWRVERHLLNAWSSAMKDASGEPRLVQLHQVKAWLVPRRDVIDAKAVIDQMIEDAAGHMPRYAPPHWSRPDERERHLWVLSPTDLHLGMLAWGEEAGEDYDSDIAVDLAARAVADLLAKAAGFPAERIALVLGNDWYHADRTAGGAGGQTAAGTQVDVDTRFQKMFRTGRRLAVQMVDMCRAVAPVEVIFVPGNHDSERAFYLGDSLQSWYRQDAAVTVRNDPRPRHYLHYGVNLLGMCHGHRERKNELALIMAQEMPQAWAATWTRDWLTGHLHRRGEREEEHTGVRIVEQPSLAGRDGWHAGQGYIHRRACEARIYHHDEGLAATLSWGPPRSPLDTTPA